MKDPVSSYEVKQKRNEAAEHARQLVAFTSKWFSMDYKTISSLLRSDVEPTQKTVTEPVEIDGRDTGMTKTTTVNDDGTVDTIFNDQNGNQTGSFHFEPSADGIGGTLTAEDSNGTQATVNFSATEQGGEVTVDVDAEVAGGLSSSATMTTDDISGTESSWSVEVVDPNGNALSGTIDVDNSTGNVIGATDDLADSDDGEEGGGEEGGGGEAGGGGGGEEGGGGEAGGGGGGEAGGGGGGEAGGGGGGEAGGGGGGGGGEAGGGGGGEAGGGGGGEGGGGGGGEAGGGGGGEGGGGGGGEAGGERNLVKSLLRQSAIHSGAPIKRKFLTYRFPALFSAVYRGSIAT